MSNEGLEKAVDALQQLYGEYAPLRQMQLDAWFVSAPLIAQELRHFAGNGWARPADLSARAQVFDPLEEAQ